MKPSQNFGKQRGTTSRACSKCGGDLGSRYGTQRYCKECHAEWMRDNRPKHSELPEDAKKKATCRSLAHYYRNIGVIEEQPCSVCGDEEAEMHHEDYSKPTQVTWYCRKHHLEFHKQAVLV